MMSIRNVIQVHHVTKHSFSNILIATLTLPNNDKLQVTLLYRSPSVPTSSLITVSANMPKDLLVRWLSEKSVTERTKVLKLYMSFILVYFI